MPVYTDQTGRIISLPNSPERIISLVPSQTELLAFLGLDNEVIGITKFCIHPDEWFRNKTRVGGTKEIKIDMVHELQPDLIIANKEENSKEEIEELEKYYPVWISDVKTIDDAFKMIYSIAEIVGKEKTAHSLINGIKTNFNELLTNDYRLKTCYLIWREPCMTIGYDTFIHSMMEAGGFENVFNQHVRYPVITIEEIKNLQTELILLPAEPFPFKEKHITELRESGIECDILLVDGEMFSWYGSRMLKAPAYFNSLRKKVL